MYSAQDDARDSGLPPGPATGSQPVVRSFTSRDCTVCDGLDGLDDPMNAFVASLTGGPASVDAASESVTDTVGFCWNHGTLLAGMHDEKCAIGDLLSKASDRMIEMLSNEKYADRRFDLFFRIDRACPVCRLHDEDVTRRIRKTVAGASHQPPIDHFCFPHYRRIAYELPSAPLRILVGKQITSLQGVASDLDALTQDKIGDDADPLRVERLARALRAIAGGKANSTDCLASDAGGNADSTCALHRSDARESESPRCPVCATISREEDRWLASVSDAARIGEDFWTVFPTCPSHIGACARIDCPRVSAAVARHVTVMELAMLERGAEMLKRDIERREIAKQSVFYRRKSAAYILGQQRKMVAPILRCPACERLGVSRQRAIGILVQRIRDAGPRALEEIAEQLCVKHFAVSYLLIPPGYPQSAFSAAYAQILTNVRNLLASPQEPVDDAILEATRIWRTVIPEASKYSATRSTRH